jgi:hypothetical protein
MWGALPDRATIADFGDNEPENYSVGSYLGRVGAVTGSAYYWQESVATAKIVPSAVDLPVFEAIPEFTNRDDEFNRIGNGTCRRFDGIEWGVIRTGLDGKGWTDENDFYCAFKSGVAGYDHNHLDQGSMILAAYSEILLSDPGRGGPDIIRQDPRINCLFEAGLGHNTLIVGDGCYMDLGLFPDNPKYYARPGKITSNAETDKYVQFTTDNSGLYPTEPLTTFRRTFLYIKPGVIQGDELGSLVVCDRILFSQAVMHSLLFHTPGKVESEQAGHARLINGGARLDYVGYCTVPSTDKVERQQSPMSQRDSSCYYRSTATAGLGSDWIHVLTPARSDGPDTSAPEFKPFTFGVDVVWKDYQVRLTVDPERGWVAGDIQKASAPK